MKASLVRECADACVLPVASAAIFVFVAWTTGASWLRLSVPVMVCGSLAAFTVYVATLALALCAMRDNRAECERALRERRTRVDGASETQ